MPSTSPTPGRAVPPAAARQIRARELAAFGTRTPRSAEWFGQARTRMLDGNEYLDFNLAD